MEGTAKIRVIQENEIHLLSESLIELAFVNAMSMLNISKGKLTI